MCSVCWEREREVANEGECLRIIFNRDEFKTRAVAEAPIVKKIEGMEVLMPLDSERGGTWISTNTQGLTVALLNNYEVIPSEDICYQSRGLIVKALASSVTVEEARQVLQSLIMGDLFPAFSVLIWSFSSMEVLKFSWNEQTLREEVMEDTFFTSSSWKSTEVQEYRTACYKQEVIGNQIPAVEFMTTTPVGEEMYSVFMTREKTQTVSVSHLEVREGETRCFYTDRNSGKISSTTLITQVTS